MADMVVEGLKQGNMIDQVTGVQESGRTAGPDDSRLDRASRDDPVVLLEAELAAMCCVVLVDAVVSVDEAENGIEYVRLQAVLEGMAAQLYVRPVSNHLHVPESLAPNTKRVVAVSAAAVKMGEDGPAVQVSRGTVAWSD